MAVTMCFGYIFYLISNMLEGQNDTFKSQQMAQAFTEDTNGFHLKEINIMPSFHVQVLNERKKDLAQRNIDIFQKVNESDIMANATLGAIDYVKLRKYIRIFYFARKNSYGVSKYHGVEFRNC